MFKCEDCGNWVKGKGIIPDHCFIEEFCDEYGYDVSKFPFPCDKNSSFDLENKCIGDSEKDCVFKCIGDSFCEKLTDKPCDVCEYFGQCGHCAECC